MLIEKWLASFKKKKIINFINFTDTVRKGMRSSYFYFDAIRKKSIRFKKYSIFLPGSLFSGTGRVTLNLIAPTG